MVTAYQLALPHEEHLHPGLAGSGRRGDDIQVLGPQVQDLLPLVYLLDGSQLVTHGCRPLELQPVRGLVHPLRYRLDDPVGLALHEESDLVDYLPVL